MDVCLDRGLQLEVMAGAECGVMSGAFHDGDMSGSQNSKTTDSRDVCQVQAWWLQLGKLKCQESRSSCDFGPLASCVRGGSKVRARPACLNVRKVLVTERYYLLRRR